MTDDPRTAEERIARLLKDHVYAWDPAGFQDSVVMTRWHAEAFARAVAKKCAEISAWHIDCQKKNGGLDEEDRRTCPTEITAAIRAHFGLEDADGK